MALTQITGVGHQVKKNAKALRACKSSLEEALRHLAFTDEAFMLYQISKLIIEADERACAAEDAVNQNV